MAERKPAKKGTQHSARRTTGKASKGLTWFDRAGKERAMRYEASVVDGRFMIHATHNHRPWIVIVEPDVDAKLLVVVTPYEVSE